MTNVSQPVSPTALAPRRRRPPVTSPDLQTNSLPAGARLLFQGQGCSLVSVQIPAATVFNWTAAFQPDSLALCLNAAGIGSIRLPSESINVQPGAACFCVTGRSGVKASREATHNHRFVMLICSNSYLKARLGACDGALHPLVERAVNGNYRSAGLSQAFELSLDQQRLLEEIEQPPVPQAARTLWYEAKVLQLMADFLFVRPDKDELFCDRQKRLARERVSRTIELLKERLVDPPSLEQIGRLVGCSPFHLSRTFSKETRMTIPQYVRKLRMERAAELLKTGKCNVTEAALEVGYSSLSHFSQAFCQTIGCCPVLYPLGLQAKAPQRAIKE
jgi:AraC family transcriptional regulator